MANEASEFKEVTDALGGIVQAIVTLINCGNPNSLKFLFPKTDADLKEMQEILHNKLSK